MIPLNQARLAAAHKLLDAFRAGGAPAPAARHATTAHGSPRTGAAKPAPREPSREERQRSPAGWPVTRDTLAAQLEKRLKGGDLPQQSNTQYCGCAAFLVALLVDRPDLYTDYAISLWTGDEFTFQGGGKAKLEVRASHGTMETLAKLQSRATIRTNAVSDLDWMTMASLSGAGANGSARDVGYPSGVISDFNAITWPAMIRRWFAAVGAAPRIDSVGIGALNASMEDFLDLLCLWDTHWIVLQIDASLLQGGMAFITQRHWVVVNPVHRPTVRPAGSKGPGERPAELRDAYRARASGVAPALGSDPRTEGPLLKYGPGVTARALLAEATVDVEVVSWAQDWHTFDKPTLAHIASRFYGGYACPRFRK